MNKHEPAAGCLSIPSMIMIMVVAGCNGQPAADIARPSAKLADRAEPAVPHRPKIAPMVIHSSTAARWSTDYDAQTRKALQSGQRRLVVSITDYDPPAEPTPLVVRLLTGNSPELRELDRFSIHPHAAFKAENGVEPQRFLISLASVAELLEESELRLEIGFDSSNGETRDGRAEISVEIVDAPNPA
jgi:hypothetical protein